MQLRVLISGASVAGPALAYWLSRYGFVVTVVEQAPHLRGRGYAVDFRGASVRVLDKMNLLPSVFREQTNMGTVSFVDHRNRRLASMPDGLTSGEVEIMRGDLTRILYEATCHDAEYIFGDSIASLNGNADGVDVIFKSGLARTFDLVVGADGLHSNVRALTFGSESEYIRHLGCYVCIFTAENRLGLDRAGVMCAQPGRVAGLYSTRDPNAAIAALYFTSPSLEYDRHDVERQKQIVRETFATMGWEMPRLLENMRHVSDFYFDSVSQIKMKSWSRDRIALLGDAACCSSPLSGMGTGLAVVGAYVLAGELKDARGDYQAAFARYETLMRPYVEQCQKLADGASEWFIPSSQLKGWFLIQAYKLLPYTPWANLMKDGPLKAANSIVLKDYEGCDDAPFGRNKLVQTS